MALVYFDKVLRINPRNADALYDKGVTLASLGRYDEAIACYDMVLRMQIYHTDALNNKGVACAALGRYEEAVTCFDRVLRVQPALPYRTAQQGTCSCPAREARGSDYLLRSGAPGVP